jgi:hypothetical protein
LVGGFGGGITVVVLGERVEGERLVTPAKDVTEGREGGAEDDMRRFIES